MCYQILDNTITTKGGQHEKFCMWRLFKMLTKRIMNSDDEYEYIKAYKALLPS